MHDSATQGSQRSALHPATRTSNSPPHDYSCAPVAENRGADLDKMGDMRDRPGGGDDHALSSCSSTRTSTCPCISMVSTRHKRREAWTYEEPHVEHPVVLLLLPLQLQWLTRVICGMSQRRYRFGSPAYLDGGHA